MTRKVYAPGLITLLTAIYLTSIASAQTSWLRTYGGTNDDGGESVQQTTDGGFIIAGCTESFGAGGADFYLIKTDDSGDTLWTKTYGGTGYDYGNFVRQTTDGGYIVVGCTKSFGTGGYDVYLVKTNNSGDTLWTRTYGGESDEWGCSIRQTTDGGYVIAGITGSLGVDTADVYLLKTNASGDTLWTRTYGGTGFDWGNSVQQTTDGGYIIAGTTSTFGAGSDDVYLVKTNAQGDTLWTRTYGGTGEDYGNSVQQTSDGGYIIAGWTESFGAGLTDVYLIKTNASGDSLWTRTYGGTSYDEGNSVQQTKDGGYVIAGYTTSSGTGNVDVYLIKTDSLGDVGVAEPLTGHPLRPTRFLIQPNPFTSFSRVAGHETELFALSDVTGRQVAICKGDRIGEGLRPGVYFLSPVGTKSGKTATTTIIKAAY